MTIDRANCPLEGGGQVSKQSDQGHSIKNELNRVKRKEIEIK